MSYQWPTGWAPQSVLNAYPVPDGSMDELAQRYGLPPGTPTSVIMERLNQDPTYTWGDTTTPPTSDADALSRLQGYSFNGTPITDLIDQGQAFVTPQGSERSYYYLGGTGDPGQFYTNADVESFRDDQETRRLQGSAQVAALVGGAAALGATPWGSATTGAGAAAADGLAPIVAGNGAAIAAPIAGGNAAVNAATAAAWGGSVPAIASLPAALTGGGGAISNNLPSILQGAATLLGGKLASDAAGDAVDAQVQAGREALDYQRESRDMALDIARPQLQASNIALARMLSMTGQPIPAALQEALTAAGVTDIGKFNVEDDPSYQWRLDQSMKALESGAFARGGGMSGGFAQKALRYAQDYASTEYSNIYGRLATVAGYGPVAMNTSSNSALNYGANASRTALEGGDARASGYVAQSNAWQNALDQIAKLPWDQWFGKQPATATARSGSWG